MRKEHQGLGTALSSYPAPGRTGGKKPRPSLSSGPPGRAGRSWRTAGIPVLPFRPHSTDLPHLGWKPHKDQASWTPRAIPTSWLLSHQPFRHLVSGLRPWTTQETPTQGHRAGLLSSHLLGHHMYKVNHLFSLSETAEQGSGWEDE